MTGQQRAFEVIYRPDGDRGQTRLAQLRFVLSGVDRSRPVLLQPGHRAEDFFARSYALVALSRFLVGGSLSLGAFYSIYSLAGKPASLPAVELDAPGRCSPALERGYLPGRFGDRGLDSLPP